MSDDEKGFIVGSLLNRGIPDHDALRNSQACHVGVNGVRLAARQHQEHTVWRNGNARMFRQFFDGSNQIWMLLAQRLELVEQRIDQQGGDHDQSKENQHRGKPEIQPPAPRAAPHHGDQDQDQNDSKRRAEKLSLGPIPEPRAPALNGLFVMQGKRMPIQAQGQVQNVDGQEKQWDENQSLNPFLVARVFGHVPKLCRPAQPKDQKEEKSAKKIGDEVKRVARPRVRHCLRLALMRKRVLFGPGLFRSLRFRRRTLPGTGLLRRRLRRRCFWTRGWRGARRTARRHRET